MYSDMAVYKLSAQKKKKKREWAPEHPKDTKLQTEIIKLHHDSPIAGHPGQWKTLELILCNYWWPGITQKVNDYVSGCDRCQRMKSFPEKPAGKLKPNESTIAP